MTIHGWAALLLSCLLAESVRSSEGVNLRRGSDVRPAPRRSWWSRRATEGGCSAASDCVTAAGARGLDLSLLSPIERLVCDERCSHSGGDGCNWENLGENCRKCCSVPTPGCSVCPRELLGGARRLESTCEIYGHSTPLCHNGGNCTDTAVTEDNPQGFECSCVPGYTGDTCEEGGTQAGSTVIGVELSEDGQQGEYSGDVPGEGTQGGVSAGTQAAGDGAENPVLDGFLNCDEIEAVPLDQIEDRSLSFQLTPNWCYWYCMERGAPYFGLQASLLNSGSCICFNENFTGGPPAPPERCNTPCAGDADETCGGILANSVYKITPPELLPSADDDQEQPPAEPVLGETPNQGDDGAEQEEKFLLEGCFRPPPPLGLLSPNPEIAIAEAVALPELTPAKCWQHCGDKTPLFGLQQKLCLCLRHNDQLPKLGGDFVPDPVCTVDCEGDPSVKCGGLLINSVYNIIQPAPNPKEDGLITYEGCQLPPLAVFADGSVAAANARKEACERARDALDPILNPPDPTPAPVCTDAACLTEAFVLVVDSSDTLFPPSLEYKPALSSPAAVHEEDGTISGLLDGDSVSYLVDVPEPVEGGLAVAFILKGSGAIGEAPVTLSLFLGDECGDLQTNGIITISTPLTAAYKTYRASSSVYIPAGLAQPMRLCLSAPGGENVSLKPFTLSPAIPVQSTLFLGVSGSGFVEAESYNYADALGASIDDGQVKGLRPGDHLGFAVFPGTSLDVFDFSLRAQLDQPAVIGADLLLEVHEGGPESCSDPSSTLAIAVVTNENQLDWVTASPPLGVTVVDTTASPAAVDGFAEDMVLCVKLEAGAPAAASDLSLSLDKVRLKEQPVVMATLTETTSTFIAVPLAAAAGSTVIASTVGGQSAGGVVGAGAGAPVVAMVMQAQFIGMLQNILPDGSQLSEVSKSLQWTNLYFPGDDEAPLNEDELEQPVRRRLQEALCFKCDQGALAFGYNSLFTFGLLVVILLLHWVVVSAVQARQIRKMYSRESWCYLSTEPVNGRQHSSQDVKSTVEHLLVLYNPAKSAHYFFPCVELVWLLFCLEGALYTQMLILWNAEELWLKVLVGVAFSFMVAFWMYASFAVWAALLPVQSLHDELKEDTKLKMTGTSLVPLEMPPSPDASMTRTRNVGRAGSVAMLGTQVRSLKVWSTKWSEDDPLVSKLKELTGPQGYQRASTMGLNREGTAKAKALDEHERIKAKMLLTGFGPLFESFSTEGIFFSLWLLFKAGFTAILIAIATEGSKIAVGALSFIFTTELLMLIIMKPIKHKVTLIVEGITLAIDGVVMALLLASFISKDNEERGSSNKDTLDFLDTTTTYLTLASLLLLGVPIIIHSLGKCWDAMRRRCCGKGGSTDAGLAATESGMLYEPRDPATAPASPTSPSRGSFPQQRTQSDVVHGSSALQVLVQVMIANIELAGDALKVPFQLAQKRFGERYDRERSLSLRRANRADRESNPRIVSATSGVSKAKSPKNSSRSPKRLLLGLGGGSNSQHERDRALEQLALQVNALSPMGRTLPNQLPHGISGELVLTADDETDTVKGKRFI